MASKTANVMARVEPDIKEQAEQILNALGISASNAINMLYRQIVLTRSLPFDLTLPAEPVARDEMTAEKFNMMLAKGLSDAQAGEGVSLDQAFDVLKSRL